MEELLVSKIPLFASLTPDERRQVVDMFHLREFPPGTVILQEGEAGYDFYFLLEGEVEIVKAMAKETERLLGVRGPGEFLGEMSLFNNDGKRTASVRTLSKALLLEMSHQDFEGILGQFPKLAQDLLRLMSLRLRNANEATLRDLREKNRQLAEAYEELLAAQAQIIEKEKLDRELQLARDIQMSYLPRELPCVQGFDFGARMLPARAVGGDFYDFISLDDGRLGIVVADVADKGVPASIMMALTRSILRAEALGSVTPGNILRAVNRHVVEMNESGMFVTIIYGLLDPRDRTFTYARAGHEFPLLFETNGGVRQLPSQPGQPVGILPDPRMDEQVITLQPGNTLLLFTDGLPDAVNSQGEFFGAERLQSSVELDGIASSQEICDRLIGTIKAFQGSNSQFDDMTLVVIRAWA